MTAKLDQSLLDEISQLVANKTVWLAYSGGVDSHVLLHLLAKSDQIETIHAIHIDHGLQQDSAKWTQHCQETALALNCQFHSVQVEVKDIATLGMEAAARTARYQAFKDTLATDDVFLTAQHQQDQAETLLLQLLRGAGPKGLSAMATRSHQADLEIIRPLLAISKQAILTYAEQHQLKWIDDPSNSDTQWNRNYIRHTLWPDLIKRWPSAAKTISRSAEHCAEADELMTDLAQQDCLNLSIDCASNTLNITDLLTLSTARQRNLLKHYLEKSARPSPSTAILHCIIDELCLAQQDAQPVVTWADIEVRRYQNILYFMTALTPHDNSQVIAFNDLNNIELMANKTLQWQQTSGQGISEAMIKSGLTLRFRQGGETVKLQGQEHHKTLKHLFQQWQIPPWQRDHIPLIYKDNQLISVMGYGVSEYCRLIDNEQAYLAVIKA